MQIGHPPGAKQMIVNQQVIAGLQYFQPAVLGGSGGDGVGGGQAACRLELASQL